ncbi:Mpo1-like protein [Nevskia sp.]|uniref:Mpo1 family 2-hydroxy fatty acid dioxygenase n=1 Tax=Nevskia sp. TaxID=1929292 RepID=UPI0025E6D52B|nr:Mpo1-like protein [Nevskia sp.]
MKSIHTWLAEYNDSHQNPANKRLHWLCVPPIVITVFGALRALPSGDALLNPATVMAALALIYYFLLSWRLALGIVPLLMLVLWLVETSHAALGFWHLPLMAAVFVLAWIGQFVGHRIEGKKPSFFKDIQFLMIGPLWLLADLYRRADLDLGGRQYG